MDKTYKFKAKGLFFAAGIFCLLTIILLPLGIFFIHRAFTAKIVLTPDRMYYYMFGKKEILYGNIRKMLLKKPVGSHYYLGAATAGVPVFVNFATVVPLEITYLDAQGKEKRTKLSSNMFENPQEILQTLEHQSGIKVEVEG